MEIISRFQVSFYTFGAGEDSVTVDDVRVVRGRPEEVKCSGDLVKDEHGGCVMNCHEECMRVSSLFCQCENVT